MKLRSLLTALFAAYCVCPLAAQPYYAPAQAGSVFTYSVETNGEKVGYRIRTVESVRQEDDGLVVEISCIDSSTADPADAIAPAVKETVRIGDAAAVYEIAMPEELRRMMTESGAENLTVESADMIVPNAVKTGAKLPDYYFRLEADAAGQHISMAVVSTDRTVAAVRREKTPAGKFDCMVIREKSTVVSNGDPATPVDVEYAFAQGIGIVRQRVSVAALGAKIVQEWKLVSIDR